MGPRKDRERLVSEMEELFADLCQVPRFARDRRAFRPRVDVFRTDDPPAITVVVELAGVDPDRVEVSLADGMLVLRGARPRDVGARRVYQHMEIDYGPFERRVEVSDPIDAENVEATYVRGLLTVVLPIATRPSRRVAVQVTARRSS